MAARNKWSKEYMREYQLKYRIAHGQKPKQPHRKADEWEMQANHDFKLDFFKALDDYMVEYNPKQIANSNRLYQYVYSVLGGVSSARFSRYLNEYKKKMFMLTGSGTHESSG